jgi:putative SOS response-associated peptidase YedK
VKGRLRKRRTVIGRSGTFGLLQIPSLVPRNNLSPTQAVPVIGSRAGGQALLKWGFVPHWSGESPKMRPMNAKAETVAQSVMFGESFRRRRCIVPADRFYEWRTVNKKKMPVWFHLKDNAPFGFAGIWNVGPGPEGKVFTVAILTTVPNDLTRTVHDRMPVILKPESEATWLEPAVDNPDKLIPLVGPYSANLTAADAANPAMNKPSFEGPDCLVPPAVA